jgi:hypothetical protein
LQCERKLTSLALYAEDRIMPSSRLKVVRPAVIG